MRIGVLPLLALVAIAASPDCVAAQPSPLIPDHDADTPEPTDSPDAEATWNPGVELDGTANPSGPNGITEAPYAYTDAPAVDETDAPMPSDAPLPPVVPTTHVPTTQVPTVPPADDAVPAGVIAGLCVAAVVAAVAVAIAVVVVCRWLRPRPDGAVAMAASQRPVQHVHVHPVPPDPPAPVDHAAAPPVLIQVVPSAPPRSPSPEFPQPSAPVFECD